VLTFVCDQCGATGSADRPGAARCTACGYVAFVEAPAGWGPPPEPDRVAAPTRDRPARELDGETVAVTERFATLWVRPGAHEVTEPHPLPAPPARARTARRVAIAGALLAGGAALAWVAVVIAESRWPGAEGGGGQVAAAPAAPAPAARPAVATLSPAPIPALPADATKQARVAAARRAIASTAAAQPASRAGLVNPAPQDRRCVPRALRARRDLSDRMPPEIAVRLRVAATGEVARIEVLDVADGEVAEAIGDAVRSCQFSPGTDEDGRPVSLPIVMRIRFASREATAGF
jgi:hypothetical protein